MNDSAITIGNGNVVHVPGSETATMRRFHSYGPVECRHHFCVPRNELVERCFQQLIGLPEEGGHFFTIWAPRQTGKTWLMRQVKEKIARSCGDRFVIGTMSMQGVILKTDAAPEASADEFLAWVPSLIRDTFGRAIDIPGGWEDWPKIFHKTDGVFDKPVLLFIDEFDSLPPSVIDRLVTLSRDMYLKRDSYLLHGLALIGVRAVLGVESLRGSPFNIQRSLRVPNFTIGEVTDLFTQYQSESGQSVDPEVVGAVYDATRGQPGLVCWFGELLTETYAPGPGEAITAWTWNGVYAAALRKEWNNTILNLIKKAQGPYAEYVLELFTTSDLPFSIRAEWCAYLYLNGIIDETERTDASGHKEYVCRFSSPFVQTCLYEAFTQDLANDRAPILALEPLDQLSDVFDGPELGIPALLERYRKYLKRLRAKGVDPWKHQPRRSDLHLTEYVGHFHLYFWLCQAVEDGCVVSPEFPTGNGRVDLHLKCDGKVGLIEVKSYKSQSKLGKALEQAAAYARKLGLSAITIALFAPVEEEDILARLSGQHAIDGIQVTVMAIGWT